MPRVPGTRHSLSTRTHSSDAAVPDVSERAQPVLKDVSLGYLAAKVGERSSAGIRPCRAASASALLLPGFSSTTTNIIIMDEATAALDIDSEFRAC
jgi:hypothetical protein